MEGQLAWNKENFALPSLGRPWIRPCTSIKEKEKMNILSKEESL